MFQKYRERKKNSNEMNTNNKTSVWKIHTHNDIQNIFFFVLFCFHHCDFFFQHTQQTIFLCVCVCLESFSVKLLINFVDFFSLFVVVVVVIHQWNEFDYTKEKKRIHTVSDGLMNRIRWTEALFYSFKTFITINEILSSCFILFCFVKIKIFSHRLSVCLFVWIFVDKFLDFQCECILYVIHNYRIQANTYVFDFDRILLSSISSHTQYSRTTKEKKNDKWKFSCHHHHHYHSILMAFIEQESDW